MHSATQHLHEYRYSMACSLWCGPRCWLLAGTAEPPPRSDRYKRLWSRGYSRTVRFKEKRYQMRSGQVRSYYKTKRNSPRCYASTAPLCMQQCNTSTLCRMNFELCIPQHSINMNIDEYVYMYVCMYVCMYVYKCMCLTRLQYNLVSVQCEVKLG